MSQERHKLQESELQGFKYFKAISGMLEGFHKAGCQYDRAGNRKLHMDQYVSLLLLYMFNPICTSLRAVQQASELQKVQRTLGGPRASLGSLSEAASVFDSALMDEIVATLAAQLRPISSPAKLEDVHAILTAVDGTLIHALPKMTWALWKSEQNAVKAHTQFDLQKYVPVKMTITEGRSSEIEVLANHLDSGRLYVKDHGYISLALFQRILDAGSSFVCRLKDNSVYECLQEHELTDDACAAGIVFDKKVRLGCNLKTQEQLSVPVRLIAIRCTPHTKRYKIGRGGPTQGQTLLIVTDRFDLEADGIALIFRHRWAVEIFFRFFKHVLGCRHLLSYNRNGIELQTYAAIIACMLIGLWTGRKPTLRTYETLCWYFTGMADEDELLSHIQRLQKIG
jgi:Transposase DDE domain